LSVLLLIFGLVLKEIIHPFQISEYALDTVLHPWNCLNSSKVNLHWFAALVRWRYGLNTYSP